MSVKDGPSCPGCGLPNYEGLCPHCRGDQDAFERELVPPFDSTADRNGAVMMLSYDVDLDDPETAEAMEDIRQAGAKRLIELRGNRNV